MAESGEADYIPPEPGEILNKHPVKWTKIQRILPTRGREDRCLDLKKHFNRSNKKYPKL